MENFHQDKRSRKLFGVCKFLQTIYQELYLYGKTTQWTQRKKGLEIGRRTLESIWRAKGQNYKSTSTYSSKERGKIPSGNNCFRICYRRGVILRTRWKMKTYCIFVQNNATSGEKLQNL